MASRRKFSSKFKTKVVLEALKERSSLAELAKKYEIAPTQISMWKREFLDGAEDVFSSSGRSKKSESGEEKDALLKTIGKLKVEVDFLKDALR